MESLSEIYNKILSEITVNSIKISKMEVTVIRQKISKLLKDYSKISSQNRTSLLSLADFCDILIQLINERYNLLNDAFYCQNIIGKSLGRSRNERSIKSKETSIANNESFNIVTQTQINTTRFTSLKKCRHFNNETKIRLEEWYRMGDFSKESTQKLLMEVSLNSVQIKNWIANKKRKEKKAISNGIIEVLKTFAPTNVFITRG